MKEELKRNLSKEDIKKYEEIRKKLFETDNIDEMKQYIPYLALLRGKAYSHHDKQN